MCYLWCCYVLVGFHGQDPHGVLGIMQTIKKFKENKKEDIMMCLKIMYEFLISNASSFRNLKKVKSTQQTPSLFRPKLALIIFLHFLVRTRAKSSDECLYNEIIH